jgi:hypothetical protein
MESPTDWKVVGDIWWFLKFFWLNWKFKLNITDGITDEMIKNINI